MNGQPLLLILHGGLAILLCIAIATDLRSRIIDNWLNAMIALGAPIMWYAAGLVLWPDVATQIAIAIAVFALFAGLFALGAMGGGDVKMLGALALWFPLLPLVNLLIVMSIIGGLLTIGMLIHHKVSKAEGKIEVPYGVAISLAGLWSIYERYLNHFG
jgi:prepilin peptidase CpaA